MLPIIPFDGQVFIDAFRVKWVFDAEVECWKREGTEPNIPLATSEQSGLLSSEFKNLIDTVPSKGGGFGIIVDPKLVFRTNENPDGIIFGDVEFISDSLDIKCVHPDGKEITEDCKSVHFAPEAQKIPPGFDINFSETFLKSICAEVPGGPGPKGDEGEKGDTGAPGTGDGPVGDQGEAGEDAVESVVFGGVKIEEVDDIFDTAVVNLELSADSGELFVVKANIKVPDDDLPADQVIASSINRSLNFNNDEFGFDILKPSSDELDADITIANYPPSFNIESDIETVQPNAGKLSTYVNRLIEFFRGKLVEAAEKYDKDLEEFFKMTDAAAREKLDLLGMQLADCEFQLPLDYCVGINPEDCSDGNVGFEVEEQEAGLCDLVNLLIPEAAFCDTPTGQDLGELKLEANESQKVSYSGSTTLPAGAYLIVYDSGTLFDSGEPGRGHFVGTTKTNVGVQATIIEPDSSSSIQKFPVSGEESDKFEADSVEAAYRNGPIAERSFSILFTEDGGSIEIESPTDTEEGTGEVTFRVLRCTDCVTPVP